MWDLKVLTHLKIFIFELEKYFNQKKNNFFFFEISHHLKVSITIKIFKIFNVFHKESLKEFGYCAGGPYRDWPFNRIGEILSAVHW